MKCSTCGANNKEENRYCTYCGGSLTYLATKIYPNCKLCKWLDNETHNWLSCAAQGFKSFEESSTYGTSYCFGVYEPKN